MGYKNAGFPDFRLNPIGFRLGGDGVPYQEDALHYSKTVDDTTRPDRTGTYDRTSVMAKKFVGDSATGTHIDAGIIPNNTTRLKFRGKFNSFTAGTQLFGCRNTGGDRFYIGYGSTGFWRFAWNTFADTAVSADLLVHDFELADGKFYLDGNVIGTIGGTLNTITSEIYLLAHNDGGSSATPCDFDLYYAEIIHNGETITFIPEEITDPTDNSQTTFYDTSGTYEAQAYLTHASWVANSVQGVANSDEYGYTLSRGLGKNLFNVDSRKIDKYIEADGSLQTSISFDVSPYMLIEPSTQYYLTGKYGTDALRYAFYDADLTPVLVGGQASLANPFTSPADARYFAWTLDKGWIGLDLQLELGGSATAFEAWEGYYKDSAHTIPYADGQPLHAFDLQDGTFSRLFCKAWLDTGAQAPLDSVGRIKHQVDYGVVLLNEVTNGDFSDGTTGWTSNGSNISESGNILSVTGDGTSATPSTYNEDADLIASNKYYLYAKVKVTNADCQALYMRVNGTVVGGTLTEVDSVLTPINNTQYELNGFFTQTDQTGKLRQRIWHNYVDAATANGKVMEVDGTAGVFAINMTALGIESFSKAQMLALVQDGYFDDYKFFPESVNDGPNSFRLQQDYPLVQSADLTDTLVDDHTLDEPTNAVVSVATLANVTGNQIFATKDSGELIRLLVYDREMTLNETGKIGMWLGISEFLYDSEGSILTDVDDEFLYAYKDGITWE